jgi:hypothetical protein
MPRCTERCSGKYAKKLIGRTEIEDALKNLDKLTREETWMATAQILGVTHAVDGRVREVGATVAAMDNRVAGDDDLVVGLTGSQLRQDIRRWLSPPDPSTNHNIARSAHHEGTATWFFQGDIFKEWKSTPSLLWIHGKRMPL